MRPGTSKHFRNLGPAGLLQPQFPTVSICLLQMLSTQLLNPVSSGDPLAQLQGNHQMHGNGQYIFQPPPLPSQPRMLPAPLPQTWQPSLLKPLGPPPSLAG